MTDQTNGWTRDEMAARAFRVERLECHAARSIGYSAASLRWTRSARKPPDWRAHSRA